MVVYQSWLPNGSTAPRLVVLGVNDVAALVLERGTGALIEWVSEDTYWETIQNLANSGDRWIILDTLRGTQFARRIEQWHAEYADCFGLEVEAE